VHFKAEILVDANLNVEPTGALCSRGSINVDIVAVLDTEMSGIVGRHMNVAVSDDTTLIELYDALRTDDRYRCRALDLTRFANWRLYLKNVGICNGYLNLACATDRTEHANALDRTHRGTNNGQSLLASVLTGLGEILEVGKGITLAEKHLKMLL
jgi:hypothetical protein